MKVRIHHHAAIVLGAALAIQKAPRILDRGCDGEVNANEAGQSQHV
jgi:hypothetical protein